MTRGEKKMKKFEFKQEVKCNCGCNRIAGIVIGESGIPGMWLIEMEDGVALAHENRIDAVESEVKEIAEEKVKIPKEIAEVLDLKAYASSPNAMWEILNKQAHKLFKTTWIFEKGNLIKLARAIEYGYEVEGPTIQKGDYVVFENEKVKWIAECCGVEDSKLQFDYAIEFNLGKYDYDNGGEVPIDMFDVRLATAKEVKELKRAASFIKNNRTFNLFMPFDIATDTNGAWVRVVEQLDVSGDVVVLYGNEEDGYLATSRPAAELNLQYLAEDRANPEG